MQFQKNHSGLRQQVLLHRAGSHGAGAPEKCLLVFDQKHTCAYRCLRKVTVRATLEGMNLVR